MGLTSIRNKRNFLNVNTQYEALENFVEMVAQGKADFGDLIEDRGGDEYDLKPSQKQRFEENTSKELIDLIDPDAPEDEVAP